MLGEESEDEIEDAQLAQLAQENDDAEAASALHPSAAAGTS